MITLELAKALMADRQLDARACCAEWCRLECR